MLAAQYWSLNTGGSILAAQYWWLNTGGSVTSSCSLKGAGTKGPRPASTTTGSFRTLQPSRCPDATALRNRDACAEEPINALQEGEHIRIQHYCAQ